MCIRDRAYMARIVAEVACEANGQRVPIILFTKGGGAWLEDIAATGCDAVGVDWTVDLGDARRRIGTRVALQGNLDPAALAASPTSIRQQVAQTLADFGSGCGHIFNLGHGIQPWTDPEHVQALVEAVLAESPSYHAVSYTHLDVYKRQSEIKSAKLPRLDVT